MLLSFDSSAVTASAALTDGDRVIQSEFINAGLTHSETLLPMIKRVMQGYRFDELEAIAVTAGPGSFTGIRIGVATAKGLAFQTGASCIAVSTLEAIAHNFENGLICAVMDARRMQFYNAIFKAENGRIERLCPDRAVSIEQLRAELASQESFVLAGDGAQLCYQHIGLENAVLAPSEKQYQNAVSIAKAAKNKKRISAKELMPVYLRMSQAERELKLKKENKL